MSLSLCFAQHTFTYAYVHHTVFVCHTDPLTLDCPEIDLQLVRSVCFTTLDGLGFDGIKSVPIRETENSATLRAAQIPIHTYSNQPEAWFIKCATCTLQFAK